MHFCPVSQVLGLDTSYLYSGKTCTEGSEIQAGVWSSGAVILEWFHLILAMGDWLKSLKNQCDWVTGLCNGPVPGQGLSSLVTKLERTGIAVRQSRSSLQLCHLQKTSARFQWETPRSLEKPGQVSGAAETKKTPHAQLCRDESAMKSFSQEVLRATSEGSHSCPPVLGHVLAGLQGAV